MLSAVGAVFRLVRCAEIPGQVVLAAAAFWPVIYQDGQSLEVEQGSTGESSEDRDEDEGSYRQSERARHTLNGSYC